MKMSPVEFRKLFCVSKSNLSYEFARKKMLNILENDLIKSYMDDELKVRGVPVFEDYTVDLVIPDKDIFKKTRICLNYHETKGEPLNTELHTDSPGYVYTYEERKCREYTRTRQRIIGYKQDKDDPVIFGETDSLFMILKLYKQPRWFSLTINPKNPNLQPNLFQSKMARILRTKRIIKGFYCLERYGKNNKERTHCHMWYQAEKKIDKNTYRRKFNDINVKHNLFVNNDVLFGMEYINNNHNPSKRKQKQLDCSWRKVNNLQKFYRKGV